MSRALRAECYDGRDLVTVRIGPERHRPLWACVGCAVVILLVLGLALFAGLLEQSPPVS